MIPILMNVDRSFYSILLSCFRNGLREVVGIQDIYGIYIYICIYIYPAMRLYEKVKSCRLSVDHH